MQGHSTANASRHSSCPLLIVYLDVHTGTHAYGAVCDHCHPVDRPLHVWQDFAGSRGSARARAFLIVDPCLCTAAATSPLASAGLSFEELRRRHLRNLWEAAAAKALVQPLGSLAHVFAATVRVWGRARSRRCCRGHGGFRRHTLRG
eukprot:scaffold3190_cov409-Prasinococcus_capsulatus_cf.AAC.17